MGLAKTLGVTPDYVLNMSYENFILYSQATPVYDYDSHDRQGARGKSAEKQFGAMGVGRY